MGKITDNISSLKETMELLEKLKTDSEFITEQGLTEEDVSEVTKELYSKVNEYKSEISEYVVFKTKQMQEDKILMSGTEEEILRLQNLHKHYKSRIDRSITWIDAILQMVGIDELETPVCKLSYRKGEQMKVEDISALPESLLSYSTGVIVPKDKKVFEDLGYEIHTNPVGLPTIKKRYKELPEDQKKELEGKVYIQISKNLQFK